MSAEKPIRSNTPEFSVSELAFSLKRTLEDGFSHVRVRGELSRVSIPKSGHLYTGLKDEKSVIDAVCWKGVLSKLSLRPEEGLEVICTGRITTYPARSNYQMIIETMELAGEGALLKMLEERKKKLAAEGLFSSERKQDIPFLPCRIGVVTSPTGAVIRDILHRLNDRFPRPVMVWPVKVQGEGAAKEIVTAIDGFNALTPQMRPDLIIVARGGGSLEDLMPFNEEEIVRGVARSSIPIISAIGHETDTTLIDYAADLRAPTPTGAAEMAVPVRLNLIAQIADNEKRLRVGAGRLLSEHSHKLEALSAKLGNPERLLELKAQRLDHTSQRIESAFQSYISKKSKDLMAASSRLTQPTGLIEVKRHQLERWIEPLENSVTRLRNDKSKRLVQVIEKLELLSFENVLKRGYVVVRDKNGTPITAPEKLSGGQIVDLQFKDNNKISAAINTGNNIKPKAPKKTVPANAKSDQGILF